MKNLPKKVNSIIRKSCILFDLDHRKIFYTVNEGEETQTIIYVQLPKYYRPKKTDEIIDDSNDFINGFKVVQTSNGEYAYVRESDNALLPYRYDVAFDFNQYGFAIVGKDGDVSWIDTSFRYLNLNGNMVEEELDKNYAKFNGWQGISDFSDGSIPLSRVYDGRNTYGRVSYFGIDGKFKEFYEYNGKINSFSRSSFCKGTNFDKNGYAMADGDMLFARGYYLSYENLIKLCKEKGFITVISEDAEKCFDKEIEKILKKEFKPNNSQNETK